MKPHREKIRVLLVADPFDAEAFKTHMANTPKHFQQRREQMVEVLTKLAEQLTAEERQALAEVLGRGKKKARRGGNWWSEERD